MIHKYLLFGLIVFSVHSLIAQPIQIDLLRDLKKEDQYYKNTKIEILHKNTLSTAGDLVSASESNEVISSKCSFKVISSSNTQQKLELEANFSSITLLDQQQNKHGLITQPTTLLVQIEPGKITFRNTLPQPHERLNEILQQIFSLLEPEHQVIKLFQPEKKVELHDIWTIPTMRIKSAFDRGEHALKSATGLVRLLPSKSPFKKSHFFIHGHLVLLLGTSKKPLRYFKDFKGGSLTVTYKADYPYTEDLPTQIEYRVETKNLLIDEKNHTQNEMLSRIKHTVMLSRR